MQRLKEQCGDALFDNAALVVYVWWYYKSLKSKNDAADFAISKHMLDAFVSDTAYGAEDPKDISLNIMFSSMENEMFKEHCTMQQ